VNKLTILTGNKNVIVSAIKKPNVYKLFTNLFVRKICLVAYLNKIILNKVSVQALHLNQTINLL